MQITFLYGGRHFYMQLTAVTKELQTVCRWTQKFISYSFKVQSMVETFIQNPDHRFPSFGCVTSFKVAWHEYSADRWVKREIRGSGRETFMGQAGKGLLSIFHRTEFRGSHTYLQGRPDTSSSSVPRRGRWTWNQWLSLCHSCQASDPRVHSVLTDTDSGELTSI